MEVAKECCNSNVQFILPELNQKEHTYFQELIGILRWATEIGRVDIPLEVSLLSQYQACPREGYLEHALRIFAFLDTHPKLTLYYDWRLPNANYSCTKTYVQIGHTRWNSKDER